MKAAQKKCRNYHSPQLLQTFATLFSQPIQAQPVMTCDATPSHHPGYVYRMLYQNFLLGNSQDTFHLQQLAPRLVLQLLQRLQKRAPGNGANCSNVEIVELVAIPPTHTTV